MGHWEGVEGSFRTSIQDSSTGSDSSSVEGPDWSG